MSWLEWITHDLWCHQNLVPTAMYAKLASSSGQSSCAIGLSRALAAQPSPGAPGAHKKKVSAAIGAPTLKLGISRMGGRHGGKQKVSLQKNQAHAPQLRSWTFGSFEEAWPSRNEASHWWPSPICPMLARKLAAGCLAECNLEKGPTVHRPLRRKVGPNGEASGPTGWRIYFF